MSRVPRRFTDDELNVLAICEKNGWTYADWYALPENEQVDRLAYLHRRQMFLEELEGTFEARIAEERPIEQTAYILTLLQRLTV